jgi:hypothetical protein
LIVDALTIATLVLLVALPLGVIAGRIGWERFADYLRVVPCPAVDTAGLILTTVAVVAGVIAATLPPAVRAARRRVAVELRAD